MSMAMSLARPMISVLGQSLMPGGGGGLLLDTLAVQPVAAYSLRKLRAAYTGSAIRVRRSSDNAEQDIGFVAGALDTASLLTFTGAGDGFVRTWYDQKAGTAINLGAAVAADQPKIVYAGAFRVSGVPSVCGTTTSILAAADVLGGTTAEMMACIVATPFGGSISASLRFAAASIQVFLPYTDNVYYFDVGGASAPNRISTGAISVSGTREVLTFTNSTTASVQQIWRNGVLAASDATAHSAATDRLETSAGNNVDALHEMVFFASAAAVAQRAAITTHQAAWSPGVTL